MPEVEYRIARESDLKRLAIDDDEIVSHVFVHRVPMVPRPCKIHDFFG